MTIADLKERSNHIGRMLTLSGPCCTEKTMQLILTLHYELQTDTLQQLTKSTLQSYMHLHSCTSIPL